MLNTSISVCIPTYNRPKELLEAIDSCFSQTLLPTEIVIGDDSSNNDTDNLIKALNPPNGLSIKYLRNVPSLMQSGNIRRIFSEATGDRIVLLHDDDLLTPNALEDLAKCWEEIPDLTAAYGKQYIISHDGVINEASSINLNKFYYRTSEYTGVQKSSFTAAMTQQFPNDAYMLDAKAAKSLKLPTEEEVGDSVDFAIGLRLATNSAKFIFIDKYTAKYRLSEVSVSTGKACTTAYGAYNVLKELNCPEGDQDAYRKCLANFAPIAIAQATQLGLKKEAMQIYFSKDHPLKKRLSPGGIRRLLKLVLS